MKEVILHIGLHKTGSTSIQKSLKGYNKNGVKSIGFDEENHSIPMYTVFSGSNYEYHIWKNSGKSKDEIKKYRQEYIKILTDHIGDESIERLIISGEDMSSLSFKEKHRLVKFFTDFGIEVKVIAYVRGPIEWSISVYQEMVKNGQNPQGKIKTSYKYSLEPFLELLGKEKILVFSFDDVKSKFSSVVRHFSYVVNIELQDKNENVSLTNLQLALISSLNNIGLQANGNQRHYENRRKIVNSITAYRCEGFAPQDAYKKLFAALVHEPNEQDVEWIGQEFGIKFTEKSQNTEEKIDDYLDKVLQDNFSHIANIFQNIGVKYIENISIEENFLNAFIFLETGIGDFCSSRYLEINHDVKLAGVDPYQHYLEYGIKEGRRVR